VGKSGYHRMLTEDCDKHGYHKLKIVVNMVIIIIFVVNHQLTEIFVLVVIIS